MSSITQLLAKLVAMPTITDDALANELALDYLEDFFTSYDMYCERHTYDGHGALTASTRRDNHKAPTILLAGHTDVVAGDESQFTLRHEGDKLLGRGVFDMKFALAGFMALIEELANEGTLQQYDLGIMVTTDEEYGGRDGICGVKQLVRAGFRPQVVLLPDSAGGGWNIEEHAKGLCRFDLIAKGRTTHSSRPWEGESASFKLVHALHEIKALFQNHGPETDTLNIGVIQGGESYNMVPSLMTASLEIRIISLESKKRYMDEIQEICRRHNVELEERALGLPMKTDLQNPWVQTYCDSVTRVIGRAPQPVKSFGGTDGPYFTREGIPVIVSCCEGGGHHGGEEWISKTSFERFVPILHDFLDRAALAAKPVDKTAFKAVQ